MVSDEIKQVNLSLDIDTIRYCSDTNILCHNTDGSLPNSRIDAPNQISRFYNYQIT